MKTDQTLSDRVIALPESRQLDILAAMLQKRGALVRRCPLVAILDRPDQKLVQEWIQRCTSQPYEYFIILTGEGMRRLSSCAGRTGMHEEFVSALQKMHKIVRGPKPGQALREIGLKPDMVAEQPTTDGVITSLEGLKIDGSRIGVQLYGDDPNIKLMEYLRIRDVKIDPVAPYIYAPDSDEEQVLQLIDELAKGEIDAITFTSQPQLRRLLGIAKKNNRIRSLEEGLANTIVAAVGPVMAEALKSAGIRVDVVPDTSYFMKPMVNVLEQRFQSV